MAIDRDDHLYIVDMTARIQVFTTDGQFLRVADPRPQGRQADRPGDRPRRQRTGGRHPLLPRARLFARGQAAQDCWGGSRGRSRASSASSPAWSRTTRATTTSPNTASYDRIQKFSPEERFLRQWGGHGAKPGQFIRPQQMVFDENEHLWVADACNHRIQVFDTEGKLLRCWGKEGSGPGELYYPYDLAMGPAGTIYVCEYGNHRVQKFTRDGRSLGCWGKVGHEPGDLFNPWALVLDSRGIVYVLDTNNHRVQAVKM